MTIKNLIACGIAMLAGVGTANAVTATLTVDAQGNGVNPFAINGLDWLPNSALVTTTRPGQNVVNPLPELSNTIPACQPTGVCPGPADIVQTYTHGRLGGFTQDGNPVGDLANSAEWTFEMGFQEVVHQFSGSVGFANIILRTIAGGDNFFRLYYDPTAGSDALTGRGYGNLASVRDPGGAVLILEGHVLSFNTGSGRGESTFTTTGVVDTRFDKVGTDNYPRIDSVVGQGSGTLDVSIDSFNSSFFLSGLSVGSVVTMHMDTQLNAPFAQVNPSSCFTTGSNTLVSGPGLLSGGTATQIQDSCRTNNLGTVNGVTGPFFQVQTDASSVFDQRVPEPAALALLGLGLAGLGLGRRRQR